MEAMAAQGDVQELLRMLTSRKVSMLAAMRHVKALHAERLRSIREIAEAPLAAVEGALGDAKLAKSLHAACKSHGSKAAKRAGEEKASPGPSKKLRLELHTRDLDYAAMTPDELEGSLELPLAQYEDAIRQTTLLSNRAPVLLAFAVELLRFTMPEQPPSSRLSLAQAVVSANSTAKAVSLGMETAPARGHEQVPEGQPRVRVLGRDVAVLKRSGYAWTPGEREAGRPCDEAAAASTSAAAVARGRKTWTASQKLTSKASTFVAHAAALPSLAQRAALVRGLMAEKPELETATHNAWAARARYGNSPLVQEASFDDGESGCGKFLLQTMRDVGAENTAVVLTRWYGGVMLGPDRWRLMKECVHDALSTQRRASTLSGEAVWALDARDTEPAASTVGMPVHRPERARNYLLRSFATAHAAGDAGEGKKKKASASAADEERQDNLGRLLGALRLLYASWAGVLSRQELDRRAWDWYVAVRPDVEAGPSGWGAKGTLRLAGILDLRRKDSRGEGAP